MREESIGLVGTLKISTKLQKIIDYLHYKVGSTEWSGILFYKLVKGNLQDLQDLEFEADFLYPMNIGSSAYTEFDYTGEVANAYDIFEEGLEQSTGLVHSHHSMAAFFSGTDSKELSDNAAKYNYYISLIVNFSHTYCAKIAIPAKTQVTYTSWFKNALGALINFKGEKEEKELLIGDLKVVIEGETGADLWLETRIKDLEDKKKASLNNIGAASYMQGKMSNINHGYLGKGFDWNDPSEYPSFISQFKKQSFIEKPKKEVTAKDFLLALISLGAETKDTLIKSMMELNDSIEESKDPEELEQFELALDENIEIIHDNLYGSNDSFREHCIQALPELHMLPPFVKQYKVFDVIDSILVDYVAI